MHLAKTKDSGLKIYIHRHADAEKHITTNTDTGFDLFGPAAFISLAKLLPEGNVAVWMGNLVHPRQ